jgi:hypothetical protein
LGIERGLAQSRERDEGDDDGKEGEAGVNRAESQAPVSFRLGHQVAQRCAQRAGQDIGDPESQDRGSAEVVSPCDGGNQRPEREDAEVKAEAERFRREIASRRAQREGKQDRQPVEQFAACGDDRVDGKGLLQYQIAKVAAKATANAMVLI